MFFIDHLEAFWIKECLHRLGKAHLMLPPIGQILCCIPLKLHCLKYHIYMAITIYYRYHLMDEMSTSAWERGQVLR